MTEKKKYILGIDLGTTKSVAAIYENGVPKILENTMGKRITPSFVALKKDKKTGDTQWLVGDGAKNQAVVNPLNTLYGVKRLIGRRFDDPEVAKMKALASYKIVEGPNGDAWVEVDGKQMAPAEVSAKVLRELKAAAEKYLGVDSEGKQIEVTDAVITCPAFFNDAQIKATKDAGTIAGLNILRVIKEPTAAALAYGMDKKNSGDASYKQTRNVIVYDLGGGTFDVSLLEIDMDVGVIQVKSTNGDTFLGGENFDERIMDYLINALKEESGIDLKDKSAGSKYAAALQRVKDEAEKAKIALSLQDVVDINIPFITMQEDGTPVNFEHQLTRTKLEQLVQDLIDKTKGPCQKALADAGLKASDIDDILLVGAQTRMPKVVEVVTQLFGKEPKKDISVQEIVAMGASVQGAILDGKVEGVLLLDVIPLSIGIRTAGDVMAIMVPRNSTIPATATEDFFTAEDNQPNIAVKVYQGERVVASQNHLLAEFTMKLPPGTKKATPIEISFNIDANGTLNVQAKNKLTGTVQKVTVKANGGLSEAEVEKMLKDAEKNAEADRVFKERQLAAVHAEEILKDAAEDVPEDYYIQAPADIKEAFDLTVKELTQAVASKNVDVMLEKTAKLKEVRTAMGEAFTKAAQTAQEQQATDTPAADGAAPSGPTAPEGPAA